MHEAERAGTGKIAREGAPRYLVASGLTADERVREVDRDVERQRRRGTRLVRRVPIDDPDRRPEIEILHGPPALHNSRAVERLDERPGAPVHDGRLAGVELDEQIIDLLPHHGGEHMLDGMARGSSAA